MYYYTDDDDRTFAAQAEAHRAAEKEREKAEKEKAALVSAIFTDIEILLCRNTEKVDFTDGTCRLYFKRNLEDNIADLKKKYKQGGAK